MYAEATIRADTFRFALRLKSSADECLAYLLLGPSLRALGLNYLATICAEGICPLMLDI